ncbi:MAG: type II toxin-antitoxin system HipA family toxin [Candidatus Eremiobacteraeota bacterium]|nr:type II toxin-antitoxin system HipA family toxin [Candidatus Eremiobacteraeota bacterium]
MNAPAIQVLDVDLASSASSAIPVGRLALDRGRAVLEYAAAFVASGLELTPLAPPAPGAILPREPRLFRGLHGVFADSFPDAWGEELIRRRCERAGVAYASLSALDVLAIVGRRGMGALVYRPDVRQPEADNLDLDALARGANEVLEGRDTDLLSELERLGGSSGGARPKALVALDARGNAVSGVDEIPAGYEAWLVKFRSSHDVTDIGPLETAYARMAREAGINVPDFRLIPARSGHAGYFGSKRFDRAVPGQRKHVVSAAGLLDIEWQVPQIDYDGLLRLVRRVTRHQEAVEEMMRRMIFNVVAHNRDDHAKQHAFIYGPDRRWRLAPAFDLTYSSGPGGEHYLAVRGEARDVGADAITALAEAQYVKRPRLKSIADDVLAAVDRFPEFAGDYGVSRRTLRDVRRAHLRCTERIRPITSRVAVSET